MDKVRALGLDKNTYVFWTTDNGAWQDVYPDAGYTPFRGTKGTVREGGNRVPAIAWGPGRSRPGRRTTTSSAASTTWPPSPPSPASKLPEKDREGKPIIFDSYDMSPVLFGTGKSARNALVLLHRERAVARRGARRQLQGRLQPARRRRRSRPAAWRSTPTSAGRAPRSTSPPCRRSSTSGRTRRSATTSS